MTITCVRRLEFDAGHRVHGHEGKCKHPHGHRYAVEVTATAGRLDHLGRVVDFSVIKQKVGGWLDQHWDHGFIVWRQDVELRNALDLVTDAKVYLLPTNPTAENMAQYLAAKCTELLAVYGLRVVAVRVHETPTCYAEAIL